ncbi:prefoldin subunit, putative [Entamoeba invadens IP1]|uniref:Prefoldin subunit, putative n=1 Tax=Entamoeba invadens IP1 TaxID=370355 RepID=A0A0A1TWH8_ENTIV|nr:prefoldin subunit, putative [Entamoeba invadens IP1]ELP85547.1 prefoldin subunit, putative [Entamoeba invadens IP1]|eukprot:XP_004184893.1 prefoldin subunit, putative [Entamoeba invadens IP1]
MAKVVEIAPSSIVCPVIEDVQKYVAEKGGVGPAVQSVEDTYKNLKFFLDVVSQRKLTLTSKIEEIQSTLNYVKLLQSKTNEEVKTKFEIANGLYLPVTISEPKKVNLWIGAGVMMEYSFEEAEKTLTDNTNATTTMIKKLDEDSNHLNGEIAKMEVLIKKMVDAGIALQLKK